MKKMFLGLALVATLFMTGCTDNIAAKNFGGSQEIDLPLNKRLVNVTWKYDSLWLLTVDGEALEQKPPQTYEFSEKSSFGVLEGKIIIIEH